MPGLRHNPGGLAARFPKLLFLCTAALTAGGILVCPAEATESRKVEKMIQDSLTGEERTQALEKRKRILERGQAVYRKFCIHCHGPEGRGDGPATHYLTPKPRDLRSGIFKFHSTQSNALPVDDDLVRTLQRGVPGTAMPAWGEVLDTDSIRSVVEYIKTFSNRFNREIPDYRIRVGLELPYDPLSVQQGKILYRQMRCGRCHGRQGERTGPLEKSLDDVWGHTSYVYDLRSPELYKAGSAGRDIYRTLVAGMDGTPMGAYNYLTEDERWHLVHYLQSQFHNSPPAEKPDSEEIVSIHVTKPLRLNPDPQIWKQAPAASIPLKPVQFRGHPIHELQVQSVHNETHIAFRLTWNDSQPDGALTSESGYLDEAAIQFSMGDPSVQNGPFYGMGEANKPVNIWHWKADAGQRIAGKTAKPAAVRDSRRFVNPFTESAVEELNASGFGSLYIQSLQNQQLTGRGYWENGRWTLIFIRDLSTPSRQDVNFKNQRRFLTAFAVWDGANKDKNANKVVSFWKTLVLKDDVP